MEYMHLQRTKKRMVAMTSPVGLISRVIVSYRWFARTCSGDLMKMVSNATTIFRDRKERTIA